MTVEQMTVKAQRLANGAGKPAYVVRTPTGALLVVLFPTAAVEVLATVQPSN